MTSMKVRCIRSRAVRRLSMASMRMLFASPRAALSRNQPIMIAQMPKAHSRMKRKTAPVAMRPQPNSSPVPAAMRVALRKLRVRFHAMERRTRPPSRGKPGRMLNTARMTLTNARYSSIAPKGALPPPASTEKPKMTRARARLVAGPAAAMKNSSPAERGWRARCETPPKMKRVMRGTGSPRRMATTAWASSCSSTVTNTRTAAATPRSQ